MKKLIDFAEVTMLLGLALIGCVLLIPFSVWQALKGNGLWFVPGKDKSAK